MKRPCNFMFMKQPCNFMFMKQHLQEDTNHRRSEHCRTEKSSLKYISNIFLKDTLWEDNTILWILKLCSCVSVRWCFTELV